MINFKEYVKDVVQTELNQSMISFNSEKVNNIVDSVIFDCNEIGDYHYRFDDIVEWNVNQHLSHS